MIDWITTIIECNHNPDLLHDGHLLYVDKYGKLQWEVNKRLTVEGSYSSKIQIKSLSDTRIYISGNPTKFLQGHNLFGTNDLRTLLFKFLNKLFSISELGLTPSVFQLQTLSDGDYELYRIDINESWQLKNSKDVLAWIRAVGETAYLKHRGSGQFSGDTAYFGKTSKRWSIKCYSKGQEILAKGHELPKELRLPEMLDYADKSLRIELVMRSLQLKKLRLDKVSSWDIDKPMELLLQYVSQIEMSDVYMLQDDVLNTLPPRLRMVYNSWLNHDDLKSMLAKNTFYRYRRELLKYGIDISTISPKEKSNVIPIIRVLEATPMGIPNWAYEKGLVA